MVTKTDTCSWSELKIYPGQGKKFVAKDGRTYFFLSRKCAKFWHKKTKPVKLTWTSAWRRFNKKHKIEHANKRKTKRTQRVQKAIVGLTLDDIKRRKDPKSDFRSKLRDEARKEVQDKRKKQIEKRRENKLHAKKDKPIAKNQPK
jgi:large subunit ribosomal protein L24e